MKPHAQAHLLSPTDKCKVCNEPAAKHVHYGAMTCFSCRAFFRRSIQNKTAATYVCRRSKACEINLKTRKNCQFCRYMRCIGVGMKPTWVLSEEERQRRFRKNREKQEQTGQPSKQGRGKKKDQQHHQPPAMKENIGFPELPADFSFESIENGLSEALLNGPLLLDQPLPQLQERGAPHVAENMAPVILEKQQKVVVKNEQGHSSPPPPPQPSHHIETLRPPNSPPSREQHLYSFQQPQQDTNNLFKATSGGSTSYMQLPPNQQTQHILVKTESSAFSSHIPGGTTVTKVKFEPFNEQEAIKVFNNKALAGLAASTQQQQQQQNITTTSTHPTVVLYNPSSSQQQFQLSNPGAPSVVQKSPIIVHTGRPLLQQQTSPSPVSLTVAPKQQQQNPVEQQNMFSNAKPSVIVQATPRFQQQQKQLQRQQLSLDDRYYPRVTNDIYSMNQNKSTSSAQAISMQDFSPDDSSFPLEIGSFATLDHSVNPIQYSSTMASEQAASYTTVGSSIQKLIQQYPNVQNIADEDGWNSNYEDDVYTSDEEMESSSNSNLVRTLIREPEVKFTAEENMQLERLVREHDERYRSVNFGEELIKEMIMCSMFGIPVSTSAAINGYRLSVERITRIAHNLDCFTDLPKNDQNNLLKENADLLVNLRGAIFFDKKKKGVDQVLISMGVEDLQTIKTMFTPLLKENSMKHIDYKTFNSIQVVSNPATESRYNFLQSKVANLITDDVSIILITYIILFSVDFCSLFDRRRVEQTQDIYIRMLERYIYSKMPRNVACSFLAGTLEAVTCLREMADIKKSRAINLNVKI